MIYVLPKKNENKKYKFLFCHKKKKYPFTEESITVKGEKHTLLFAEEEFLKTDDCYNLLLPFKGKTVFHPAFVLTGNLKELCVNIKEYKILCAFNSFYKFAKSGCFKNSVLMIFDKSGYLYEEIPKMLMLVKGVKIVTSSDKYNDKYTEDIFNNYGVRICVSENSEIVSNGYLCRVDFDGIAENGELAFLFNNRIQRLKPSALNIHLEPEEKELLSKLTLLGMQKDKLYGAYFLKRKSKEF